MKTALALAALILSVLSPAILRAEEPGATFEVKVPGMVCVSCSFSVTEELKKLDGITDVYVDLKTKTALVSTKTTEGPGEQAVLKAVKTAGYEGSGFAKLNKSFAEAKAALAGSKG